MFGYWTGPESTLICIKPLDDASAVKMLEQAASPQKLLEEDSKEISKRLGYSAVLLRLIGHCISNGQMTSDEAKAMDVSRIDDAVGSLYNDDRKSVGWDEQGLMFYRPWHLPVYMKLGMQLASAHVYSRQSKSSKHQTWKRVRSQTLLCTVVLCISASGRVLLLCRISWKCFGVIWCSVDCCCDIFNLLWHVV